MKSKGSQKKRNLKNPHQLYNGHIIQRKRKNFESRKGKSICYTKGDPHKTIKGFSETLQARRQFDDTSKELKI